MAEKMYCKNCEAAAKKVAQLKALADTLFLAEESGGDLIDGTLTAITDLMITLSGDALKILRVQEEKELAQMAEA